MGRRAIAEIWVGVDLTKSGLSWDEIQKKMPDSIKDEDGSFCWDDERVEEAIGVVLDRIDCSEETVGFGIILLKHNWINGVKPVDLAEINQKAQAAIPVIESLFKDWGIEDPIGVYIQTDYS